MSADALVLGGGPAGAALATLLARAGRSVVLLEKDAGPTEKVCGEFISADAAFQLASLGVNPARLGAVPIRQLRLAFAERQVSAPLPFSAWGLSRRVLDEALLETARSAGATIVRGAEVKALSRSGQLWRARTHDDMAYGRAAFLATGKHDLHGFKRPPGSKNDLVAFKLHWSLAKRETQELGSTVELFPFERGYAGLQPVNGGLANLCLVVERDRLRELGHDFERVLDSLRRASPLLASRLAGAHRTDSRPLALSNIPYGLLQRTSRGPYLVGDQAAVIPSFSGDGVAMALYGAAVAAAAFLAGRSVAEFQSSLARELGRGVRLATNVARALTWRPTRELSLRVALQAPFLLSAIAARTRVPFVSV